MTGPILEAKGISKIFPGVQALNQVDFDVLPGELHVLIGENGAGKSTLVNILQGSFPPSSGDLFLAGEKVVLKSPEDGLVKGIGGVSQELMLVPWLDVARNIFLNREPRKGPLRLLDLKAMHEESRSLLREFDLDIDTRLPVKDLGAATKQKIGLAKVLRTKPKIFILDEPTAILSERDVEILFAKLQVLKAQGTSIIYISHRMQEIRQIGDRVTVLRDGAKVGTVPVKDVTDDELIRMMVGRSLGSLYSRRRGKPGEEMLRLEGCSLASGPKDVDLLVRRGEIVGIAGLVGSGRTELARGIFGIDPFTKGRIFVEGREVKPKHPFNMIGNGTILVPEERKTQGVALKLPVLANILMASYRKRFGRFYKRRLAEKVANDAIAALKIVVSSFKAKVNTLSGGNQQKVVIAKSLETHAKIFIFDEPTRGIDVGAKVEIHSIMDELVNKGSGILMISSDLPEILGMSDRIYVMYQGRIVGCYNHDEATQDLICGVMTGMKGCAEK